MLFNESSLSLGHQVWQAEHRACPVKQRFSLLILIALLLLFITAAIAEVYVPFSPNQGEGTLTLEAKEMNYKLSPSDFAFLYEGCKRCYYLKVVHGISQPSIPLPAIFSKMAGLLKDHYDGKSTKELHPDLPPGTVRYGEKYVQSNPIRLPSHNATCFINGRFDIVVEFEDKTYGVIDFKTGKPNEEYFNLYKRQLHAYAYALENPAPGALKLSPVTKMGLLYFYPSKIDQEKIDWLSYEAKIHWEEIPKDEGWFLEFVGEVLGVLESSQPPAPSPNCQWCGYIDKLKDI